MPFFGVRGSIEDLVERSKGEIVVEIRRHEE